MNNVKDQMDRKVQFFKQQRDTLKLKFHLGRTEVRDKWNKVGKRWYQFRNKAKVDILESSHEIEKKLKTITEELKNTYGKIRGRL